MFERETNRTKLKNQESIIEEYLRYTREMKIRMATAFINKQSFVAHWIKSGGND